MRIDKIRISPEVQEKIFKKHKVLRDEIENAFFDEPYYFKDRGGRYVAIGFIDCYVTVVFEFDKGCADVVTAYRSSEWQRKLYKVKRWKK
ncbi:MAG: BrnT family toxin [Nanoarchaeota archaeon]|nr:BrnT family toxin [Nanoarchaeota archaeon]